ncbi:hypothetical protein niasHT_027790 [Heterodera trifolii]|uniref:Skp1-related protein n=1 Tax=Heterodera trifolii TaxID=157864 RepID=A0ABD2JFM4_9BILA
MLSSSSSSSSSSLSDFPPNNNKENSSHQKNANNELHGKEVKCECEGGQCVTVRVQLLLQCNAFRKTVKILGLLPEALPDEFVFPVRSISVHTFKKMVQWMEHRDGKPEPIVERDPLTGTQKWQVFDEFDKNFFKIEVAELTKLLNASHFLDFNSLRLYASQSVADLLQTKTADEIRELFGIEDDLTEEQKEQIRQKNAWCQFSA